MTPALLCVLWCFVLFPFCLGGAQACVLCLVRRWYQMVTDYNCWWVCLCVVLLEQYGQIRMLTSELCDVNTGMYTASCTGNKYNHSVMSACTGLLLIYTLSSLWPANSYLTALCSTPHHPFSPCCRLYLIVYHAGLFACIFFGQIGLQARKQGYFETSKQ